MSGARLIMLHLKLTSRTGLSGWATASDLAVHCSLLTSLAGCFSSTRIASSGIYLLSLKRTSRCFSASAALLNPIKRSSMGGRRWLILQLTLTSIMWLCLVVAKASPEVSVYIYIPTYIMIILLTYIINHQSLICLHLRVIWKSLNSIFLVHSSLLEGQCT